MLINLRNALMTGKRLPYDAEVEYLESTGTQWIDTGVIGQPDTIIEATFAWGDGAFTRDNTLIGSNTRTNRFIPITTNSNARVQIGAAGGWVFAAPSILYAKNTIYTVRSEFVSGAIKFTLDGSQVITATTALSSTNLSMYVFGSNESSPNRLAYARLYSLKIYVNGVLVRDFIPVRKGTVGYLYDRVSGKLFGNAGTGDFVLGSDVVPVEYLESHGTEYINTGVVPTSLTKWDIDAQFTSSDYGQIMGRGGDPALNPRFAFGLDIQSSGHGLTWYCGMGDVNTWNGIFDTFRHAFSLDAPHKTFTIDTTSYNVPLSSIGDTTIMQLFARFVNGGVHNFCKAKIFKSSIIDNGLLVYSFRPIRVGTDATSWEGAMMDVLTRRIYRNAGTGAFAYGADLPLETLAN